jgi:hypothetical protein
MQFSTAMSTPQSQPSKPPLARHKKSAQPSANALKRLHAKGLVANS